MQHSRLCGKKPRQKQRKCNGTWVPAPSLSFSLFSPIFLPFSYHFPTSLQSRPFPSLRFCTFQFWFLFLHGIDMAKVVGLPLFRGLGFEQLWPQNQLKVVQSDEAEKPASCEFAMKRRNWKGRSFWQKITE